jgi:hypothetical protein
MVLSPTLAHHLFALQRRPPLHVQEESPYSGEGLFGKERPVCSVSLRNNVSFPLSLRAQALSAPTCHCLRDGKWSGIAVKELVPGDIIGLKGGDVIPADSKVSVCVCVCV